MSKTKEEIDALKEEVKSVNEKLQELTPEELEQVNGGIKCVVSFRTPTIKESGCIGYIAQAMHVETGE